MPPPVRCQRLSTDKMPVVPNNNSDMFLVVRVFDTDGKENCPGAMRHNAPAPAPAFGGLPSKRLSTRYRVCRHPSSASSGRAFMRSMALWDDAVPRMTLPLMPWMIAATRKKLKAI